MWPEREIRSGPGGSPVVSRESFEEFLVDRLENALSVVNLPANNP
jgi:hypothetical protein